MLRNSLFSLLLLGFIASVSAFAEEGQSAAEAAEEPQLSVNIRADQVKEVKILSDDKKSFTVYAVDKVDSRLVDGTLLKNPKSPETKKIREEIKAAIVASGQPVETYKLKKGELEKLQSESQGYYCRQARRAARAAYWYGGGGCHYNNYSCYSYSYPVYQTQTVYYTQPTYYVQPTYYYVQPAPVYYSCPTYSCDPCSSGYGFYGSGQGYGVYFGG